MGQSQPGLPPNARHVTRRAVGRGAGLLLVLGVLLLGCGGVELASPAPLSRRTPTPTLAAPSPAPSATPIPADPCPPSRAVAAPTRPTAFEDYVAALRAYLDAGAPPATLSGVLADWGAQPQEGRALARGDVTGDGTLETVLAFKNPASSTVPPEGVLAVFTCRAGRVEVLYTYRPGEWFGLNLIGAEDLSGDGLAEITFAEVTCGAHLCFHAIHSWTWDGVNFQDRVTADLSFPAPAFHLKGDRVLVSSGGIGSAGAGPQRPVTTTLGWDGEAVTVTARTQGHARFRYHMFTDGEAALRAGDHARALDAYLQVLDNPSLQAWGGVLSADEERRWLTALARWRLMTVETLLNNPANAEAHYRRLQTDVAPDAPGYPVVPVAERYWQAYHEQDDMAYACAAAVRRPEVPAILDFLNGFGYANPTYTPGELCPFFAP